MRLTLARKIASIVEELAAEGAIPTSAYPFPEVIDTKSPEHGDFACNLAMVAAKAAGVPPRSLAEPIAARLREAPEVETAEVAGPGFLNIRLRPSEVGKQVAHILAEGCGSVAEARPGLGWSTPERPKRINVEFVSVNPNGPITIGSGRGAAFGDALCRVLTAAGHHVWREYYINDGINSEQMRLFAESVRALACGLPVPDNGYKGDYVQAVAQAILADFGQEAQERDRAWFQEESQRRMLARQQADLAAFGVAFDTWFSEQSLHESGAVHACLQKLTDHGTADRNPYRVKLKLGKGGAWEEVEREPQESAKDEDDAEGDQPTLWLRSTKFGDDMDRVLQRRDGRLTYIASDVAYHADKFNRPPDADLLVTVLGPDHHGYIGRLRAVVAATLLARDQVTAPEPGPPLDEREALVFESAMERDLCLAATDLARQKLQVHIFQIVRFMKEGQPAPMRKRDGNIYALSDLIEEIGAGLLPDAPPAEQAQTGKDVVRFFYLARSHDTHMDFDIDLAKKGSDENPVFYAQYAHARICGVLRKAQDEGVAAPAQTADLELLVHPREKALVLKVLDLPHEVARCAEDFGVHRMTTYAVELARTYHHFYDSCRVVQHDQPELTRARLALCEAARIGLQSAFDLLGITAPERM